jgi:hypothetical protein
MPALEVRQQSQAAAFRLPATCRSGGRQATISGGGGASKDGTKSNLDPDNANLLATQHPAVEVHQTFVWWRLITSDGLHFGQWRRRLLLMRDLVVCAVHTLRIHQQFRIGHLSWTSFDVCPFTISLKLPRDARGDGQSSRRTVCFPMK